MRFESNEWNKSSLFFVATWCEMNSGFWHTENFSFRCSLRFEGWRALSSEPRNFWRATHFSLFILFWQDLEPGIHYLDCSAEMNPPGIMLDRTIITVLLTAHLPSQLTSFLPPCHRQNSPPPRAAFFGGGKKSGMAIFPVWELLGRSQSFCKFLGNEPDISHKQIFLTP